MRRADEMTEPWEPRFWAKVSPEPMSGCWLWTASTDNNGYGKFARLKMVRAHRVSYELMVGPIPAGLQLDHLCRVRNCVNPAHLEPVTRKENILRGVAMVARQARQTHCKRGHLLAGDNLRSFDLKLGQRNCKPCHNERQRQGRARKKQLHECLAAEVPAEPSEVPA